MTRDEAITIMQVYKDELEHRIAKIDYDVGAIDLYSIQLDAFEVAIEALSAEAPKPTGELIARADAIEAVDRWKDYDGDICWREAIDKAKDVLSALPSADAVSRESYINAVGYVEWLEKIIVDAETFEWLCEDTNDKEWCEDNCHYSSIQAECLRHLYEVSKGGDSE